MPFVSNSTLWPTTCWCFFAACCCTALNWVVPPWHRCGCACSSSGPACIARSAACGSISPAVGPDDRCLRSCSHAWAPSARRPEYLATYLLPEAKYSLENLVAPVCCRRNILRPKVGQKCLALAFPPASSIPFVSSKPLCFRQTAFHGAFL